MLTRLKVSGFKNLVDVDLSFAPFTCITGANGAGKSNLLDAIRFLSLTADRPLAEAAQGVRGGTTPGAESLFHQSGGDRAHSLLFEAEMIVPRRGRDEYGQEAEATITFLTYRLELCPRDRHAVDPGGPLEIIHEELSHINLKDAHRHLPFPHSAAHWRNTSVSGFRRVPHFLSTEGQGESRTVKVHQDGVGGGPLTFKARDLPRTVLSRSNAAETPTALLARLELRSWRALHLEPWSLRRPDPFSAPSSLNPRGLHLASSLHRLASKQEDGKQLYAAIARRLSTVMDDVSDLWVDRDEGSELLTVKVLDRSGTVYPAAALSDGTLRFLALALLELQTDDHGLLYVEEPENGVHPERIPAVLDLLQSIAVDVSRPLGPENPLRQVLINTHSPAVVKQVPEDSLLVAVSERNSAVFHCLARTWRDNPQGCRALPMERLLAFLSPLTLDALKAETHAREPQGSRKRVVDREELQSYLPFL